MRTALCILVCLSARGFASVGTDEDAKLERYIQLLSTLRPGSSYEEVKAKVPELGPLKPEGQNDTLPDGPNTEAAVEVVLFKVPLKGEFNFHEGKLVSHGFSASKLSAGDAQFFLRKSVQWLESLNGPATRTVSMPHDPEGDCPTTAVTTNFGYEKDGITFGLEFRFDPESFSISWGAQAASPAN